MKRRKARKLHICAWAVMHPEAKHLECTTPVIMPGDYYWVEDLPPWDIPSPPTGHAVIKKACESCYNERIVPCPTASDAFSTT